ncbi:protein TolR [Thiorhodovibrio frisius]|uniref:Tol-Pal system protein TolR n=1 Tax=Thiorhodovibrio frisius TaxID=631362 RepID=H8Z825_9GAMM|nr:protein TolR [Thiorhodovibrio frisius]EIC19960.1 TolR protein [Thiorhodovibrio frisius]WPL20689.1 Biopolymer transport protein ExbD [Thiorhodovibrio frisius]
MKRKDRRNRRRPMAEINVVPYIDVMLVLLVIFMVTAPLISQGVKLDLPQAQAKPQPSEDRPPVVIHIDQVGDIYLDLGDASPEPVDQQQLFERLQAALRADAELKVMLRADESVSYGRIIDAMVAAQAAGAPSVGLVTQPPLEETP